MTFSLDELDAQRLVASSANLLGDPAVLADDLDNVLQRSRATFTGEQVDSLFEMMNRVADATGMPVGMGSRQRMADIIEDLELARLDHAD